MIRTLLTPLLFALAMSIAGVVPASAQLDSLQLHYRFKQGDAFRYRVVSYDSIVIYDVKWRTLARERVELISVRCDTVIPQGYVMTLNTTDYFATEWLDSLPPVNRDTSEWVGRSITMLISPIGQRIDLIRWSEDPGTAPGGPFSPAVLPYLGIDSTWVGNSFGYDNNGWLFDNTFPPVQWNGKGMGAIPTRKDTLGYSNAIELTLNEVGQATYQVPGSKDNPITTSVVNGAGTYLIPQELGYPVRGSYDLIVRFTMRLPGTEKKVEGRHLLAMYYELIQEKSSIVGGH